MEAHLHEDICAECRTELKPRMDEDFIEISEEEASRILKESLTAEGDIPDRE